MNPPPSAPAKSTPGSAATRASSARLAAVRTIEMPLPSTIHSSLAGSIVRRSTRPAPSGSTCSSATNRPRISGSAPTAYTIPVYEVDDATPRRMVRNGTQPYSDKASCHGASFENPVPIPDDAAPDGAPTATATATPRSLTMPGARSGTCWSVRKDKDGSGRARSTRHDLFPRWARVPSNHADFPVQDGESIHLYGPGRAGWRSHHRRPDHAGRDRGRQDRTQAGFRNLVERGTEVRRPATWTDGFTKGGPLEGGVIQLDPAPDLTGYDLSPGALVVAAATGVRRGERRYRRGKRALRRGPVRQGGKAVLERPPRVERLRGIDLRHFRFLRCENMQHGGLKRAVPPRAFPM